MTTPPPGYLTIQAAATQLGVKPWQVVRLIEADEIASLTLVDAASLSAYTQETK